MGIASKPFGPFRNVLSRLSLTGRIAYCVLAAFLATVAPAFGDERDVGAGHTYGTFQDLIDARVLQNNDVITLYGNDGSLSPSTIISGNDLPDNLTLQSSTPGTVVTLSPAPGNTEISGMLLWHQLTSSGTRQRVELTLKDVIISGGEGNGSTGGPTTGLSSGGALSNNSVDGLILTASGTAVSGANGNSARGRDGATITSNAKGGAIYSDTWTTLKVTGGQMTINNNTAQGGNNSQAAYAFGGGVYSYGDLTLEVAGSLDIDGNTAQGGSDASLLEYNASYPPRGDAWGGGIYVQSNLSVSGGGAISVSGNTARAGNTGEGYAETGGGGIASRAAIYSDLAAGGSLTVSNNLARGGDEAYGVTANNTTARGYARGGGVYSTGSQTYNGSGASYTFKDNTARGGDSILTGTFGGYAWGGGLYAHTSTGWALLVEAGRFEVSDNTAQGGDGSVYGHGRGGGAYSGGSVSIANTGEALINGNQAIGGYNAVRDGSSGGSGVALGGGLYSYNNIVVAGSTLTVSGNTARAGNNAAQEGWASGGGIYNVYNGFSFTGNGALEISGNAAQGGENAGSEAHARGGGLYTGSSGNITLSGSGGHLFKNNRAVGGSNSLGIDNYLLGGRGGAIYTYGNLNITGATFLNNSADSLSGVPSAYTAGGAIFADYNTAASAAGVSTHTLHATATQPVIFQGNTHNHSGSGPSANSIYFGNTGRDSGSYGTSVQTLNVVVDPGADFLMYDPMGSQVDNLPYGNGVNKYKNVKLTIKKTGTGEWLLGGASIMGSPTVMSVQEGYLHLYSGGEKGSAGSITLSGADSSFTVKNGAKLVAGGDNSVTAKAASGVITFDNGAAIVAGESVNGKSKLTLAATNGVVIGSLASDALSLVADAGREITLEAAFSGPGGITKTGTGKTILTSAATYTGTTTISQGTLALSGFGALNALGSVVNDAEFDISAKNSGQTVASLSGTSATAKVLLGANTLTVNNAANASYAGGITGSGGLVKSGAGTLTLAGSSSFVGGTTVSSGRIDMGHAAALGSGTVKLGTGTVLGFNGAYTVANNILLTGDASLDTKANSVNLSGTLNGAHSLTKSGAGTLALNNNAGAATALSSVTLTQGSLNIASGKQLAVSGLVDAQAGTTLGVGAGTTPAVEAASMTIAAGTTLNITSYTPADFPDPNEPCTVVRTASGITGAFANVSVAGTALPTAPDINTFLEVFVDQAAAGNKEIQIRTDLVWNKAADAHGNFYIKDGETFTLGVNLADNIKAGAGTTFSWDGKTLTKTGGGTLELTGNNTYTGETTVASGMLALGGTLASSDIFVNNGARLGFAVQDGARGKAGQNVTVQKGGVLQVGQGGSIGGDLVMDKGSSFLAFSDNRALTVAGKSTFNRGLGLDIDPIGWDAGKIYKLLRVSDPRDLANFGYLEKESALLSWIMDAEGDLLRMRVIRAFTPEELGQSYNEKHTGKAVGSLQIGHPIRVAYGTLTSVAAVNNANNQLSGEGHSTLAGNIAGLARTYGFNSLRRLSVHSIASNPRFRMPAAPLPGARHAQTAGSDAADSYPLTTASGLSRFDSGHSVWARTGGSHTSFDSNGNAGKSALYGPEITGGYDARFSTGYVAGAAFRYGFKKFDVNGSSYDADINSYTISLYGGKELEAGPGVFRLLFGGAYSLHDIESSRTVRFGGFRDALEANYKAHSFQVFGEAAFAYPVSDKLALEPYLGLAWDTTHTESFFESGGAAALKSSSRTHDGTSSQVGMRVHVPAFGDLALNAELGWLHNYGSREPKSVFAFKDGSDRFAVKGNSISRDAAMVGVGVEYKINESWRVSVNYDGVVGKRDRTHGGSAMVVFSW